MCTEPSASTLTSCLTLSVPFRMKRSTMVSL